MIIDDPQSLFLDPVDRDPVDRRPSWHRSRPAPKATPMQGLVVGTLISTCFWIGVAGLCYMAGCFRD